MANSSSNYRRTYEYVESSDNEGGSYYQDESEGEDSDSDDDVQNMSGPGETLTEADKRVMAKYIASFSDWETMSNRVKWGAFEQMVRFDLYFDSKNSMVTILLVPSTKLQSVDRSISKQTDGYVRCILA